MIIRNKLVTITLLITLISLPGMALSAETPGNSDTAINIDVPSAILVESSTGQVLYEKNADQQLAPASVTKIMTMLIVMEEISSGNLSLEDVVTTSERAKSMGGSTIFLETGEQMKVHDLLKGIAVASANDACVAIGEHISGTEAAFVERMNATAARIGMSNTHFANTNGLDDPDHYTTARDISIMSQELLKYPLIHEYTTIWTDSLRNGAFDLANTNRLVRFYKGANGLKTGSTSAAGSCISATALRDNMQLIAVVLKAPNSQTRFKAASDMLDYGFASYSVVQIAEKDQVFGQIAVSKGREKIVEYQTLQKLNVVCKKTNKKPVEAAITVPERIAAPVNKGDVIGTVTFKMDGSEVGTATLYASQEVKRVTPDLILKDMLDHIF